MALKLFFSTSRKRFVYLAVSEIVCIFATDKHIVELKLKCSSGWKLTNRLT